MYKSVCVLASALGVPAIFARKRIIDICMAHKERYFLNVLPFWRFYLFRSATASKIVIRIDNSLEEIVKL